MSAFVLLELENTWTHSEPNNTTQNRSLLKIIKGSCTSDNIGCGRNKLFILLVTVLDQSFMTIFKTIKDKTIYIKKRKNDS